MTRPIPPTVPVVGPAAVVAGLAGIELAGRSIARTSLLASMAGADVPASTMAGVAALACIVALGVLMRRRLVTPHAVMALILLAAFPAGMAVQLRVGARLQSDGFYYFAHLRSLWFDHDQDLTNDYRMLGMGDKAHLFTPTPTGYAQSAWTIGPSLVWAPFFAVGDGAARVLHERQGALVSVDGTSFPYRQSICVAGLVWGLVGLYFCFLLAARLAPGGWAVTGTAVTALGSFILWYLVKEPTMTHAPSMALVAIFAWAWMVTRGRRSRVQWAALGLLAGFMGTVRWQNVLFALLPAVEWLGTALETWRHGERRAIGNQVVDGLIFTAASVAGFVPQMLAWNAIYGHFLAVSPIGPQIRWWSPHLADVLWSSRNGLLATSPALVLSLIGLALCWRRDRRFACAALAAIGVMVYFNASIQDWWGSAAFGGRRFDGTIPLMAVGMAVALEHASRVVARRPALVAGLAGVALVAWNLTYMSAALDGVVRLGEPVAFAPLAGRQAEQVEHWTGHPGSWPANLIFALRNGLAPSDYDLLWAMRFLSDPAQPYGRIDLGRSDEPWLGAGWYAPEQDGAVAFRWAGDAAALHVVLDHPAPLRLQVRLRAFSWPGAPPATVTAVVNGRDMPSMPVTDAWSVVEQHVPADAWTGGVNVVVLRFSRAARPADVGGSPDGRRLAAAVDFVRVAVEAP